MPRRRESSFAPFGLSPSCARSASPRPFLRDPRGGGPEATRSFALQSSGLAEREK